MNQNKEKLLQWIESDREKLINLASQLIQARSPNPPGDTQDVAIVISEYLNKNQLPFKVPTVRKDRPNIVSSFEGFGAGKNLVLNGHMDVFPVDESETWLHEPWSGKICAGKIWGRGATNMKCGLAIAISTFIYLNRLRQDIAGSLTFSAVSDEIVLGDSGTQFLMKEAPEIIGDTCLLAEPSGLSTIRFGEKGPTRIQFDIQATSEYGAFNHKGEGAIRTAARLITEIDNLKSMHVFTPKRITQLLNDARAEIDEVQGSGATDILQQVTVTIATISGGIAKNMIPSQCQFIADIRLPIGVMPDELMGEVKKILTHYPNVKVEVLDTNPPSWCEPEGELALILQNNVRQLKGFVPKPIVSLGCTDARLWRFRGVPSYNYGPPPKNVGAADEYVDIEDFMHVMRTYALTSYDYLARG